MTFLPNAPYVAVFSILLVCCSLFSGSTLATNSSWHEYTDVGMVSEMQWAFETQTGHIQKLEIVMDPELEVQLPGDGVLTGIIRLRADAVDNIQPSEQYEALLRELYIETQLEDTFFTIGKQQVVWGKADGLKVLDVVNPQDFREFILDDFDSSRIPLWTLNAEIPINDITWQLLWIPDQSYHEFAEANSAYEFTSPTRLPSPPTEVSVTTLPVESPNRFWRDSDWGMQLSSFWYGWDLTINYLYHYYDTPVLFREVRLPPAEPRVTFRPQYKRNHLIGASFSNAFGDITLRGELGYSIDRYFSTNDPLDRDGVLKTDEASYVTGLDWYGYSDTLLSVQLFQSYLTKYEPGVIRDRIDTTVTFLTKWQFLNDTLIVESIWLHNLNYDDGLVRPSVTYQWNDQTQLRLGADIFYGDKNGIFGQFNQRSRMLTGIEYSL